MGIIINKSDFIGEYALVKSNSDDINLFIEKYEKEILSQLMGSDLLVLFQANLVAQIPITQIYLDIYNAFVKKVNGYTVESTGLKDMCLAYVYFYYLRKLKVKASMNGAVVNETENATQSNPTFLIPIYNRAIRTFKNIQYFIGADQADSYPAFVTIYKDYVSIL